MEKHLFISCLIMFLLSSIVVVAMSLKRTWDMRSGITDPRYFKTFDLDTPIPASTRQLVRNYSNLFEMPVFFYLVTGLILILKLKHPHFIVLAYSYVGSRVLHTLIHLFFNKLPLRGMVFGLSNIILGLMWLKALVLIL